MASSKDARPVAALLITKVRSEYTNAVDIVPCERAPEDIGTQGDEYFPRTPEEVSGIYTANGALRWRIYRERPGSLGYIPRQWSLAFTTVQFVGHVHIDEVQAGRMVHAFRTLASRQKKLRAAMGSADDFGESVCRIALAFRAEWIAIDRDLYVEALDLQRRDAFKGQRWVWVKVADARSILANLRDMDLPKDPPACSEAV